MNMLSTIYHQIQQLVATDEFLQTISSHKQTIAGELISQSLHEARWAIEFLSTYDIQGKKILEIGAGTGIVSACLHLAGAHVTMVEPSQGAFSHQQKICKALHAHLGIAVPLIDTPIEEIEAKPHTYDFIFSINVLEHIMNVPRAFAVMSYLLKDDGIMFHVCPNYTVPYEPHAGVVLVPLFPKASLFISKKLKGHPVSSMLNFITVRQIKKLAKKNHLTAKFHKDMMYKSFMRLQYDSEFQKRQRGLPMHIFTVLQRLKLIDLTKYVPVCMQTPIAFEMRKNLLKKQK